MFEGAAIDDELGVIGEVLPHDVVGLVALDVDEGGEGEGELIAIGVDAIGKVQAIRAF